MYVLLLSIQDTQSRSILSSSGMERRLTSNIVLLVVSICSHISVNADPRTHTFLTFNTATFKRLAGYDERKAGVISALKQSDHDVICLQEVSNTCEFII